MLKMVSSITAARISIAFLLTLLIVGCTRQPSQPSNPAFEALLTNSMDELKLKTEAQTGWGLGTFESWSLDQDEGDLVFSNSDGTTATCQAQIIGSYDTESKTWLWAWGNPSIVDKLKADSLKVKAYGETNHIEKLTTAEWSGDQADAWAMTALAVKLCGSQGAYRGPAGSAYVFMTFGTVKLSRKH
jgi:hypothetical protein